MLPEKCGAVSVSLMKNEVNNDDYHGQITLNRCAVISRCDLTFDEVDDLEPFNCVDDVMLRGQGFNKVEAGEEYTQKIKRFVGQFIQQAGANIGSAILSGNFKSGETFRGESGYVTYNLTLSCYTNNASIITYYSNLLPDTGKVERPVYGYMQISSEDGGSLANLVDAACGAVALQSAARHAQTAINALKEIFTF